MNLAFLKDWKTTIPALIVIIASALSLFGVLTLTPDQQNAFVFVALFIIGLFAGGIADLKTTIPALIAALTVVLQVFGIVLPLTFSAQLATVLLFAIAVLSTGVTDWKTTGPAVLMALIGVANSVAGLFGVAIPANVAQALMVIGIGIIGLLSGEPVPFPAAVTPTGKLTK